MLTRLLHESSLSTRGDACSAADPSAFRPHVSEPDLRGALLIGFNVSGLSLPENAPEASSGRGPRFHGHNRKPSPPSLYRMVVRGLESLASPQSSHRLFSFLRQTAKHP
jgi:hypothetical protein